MLKRCFLARCINIYVSQPPLGGCVLKHLSAENWDWQQKPAAFRRLCVETAVPRLAPCRRGPAAFRRLCVETRQCSQLRQQRNQPPLGGCVLKHSYIGRGVVLDDPAAFRRLCVETARLASIVRTAVPAAFRRLCVETDMPSRVTGLVAPAAFRRLCVETNTQSQRAKRLRNQPPLGGCVLKPTPCKSLPTLITSRL